MATTRRKTILTGTIDGARRIIGGVGVAVATMSSIAMIYDPVMAAEPAAIMQSNETTVRVTIEQVPYEGWQNAYRITNGTAEVIIVPQIARIMRYGFINGANLLWNNPSELGKAGDTGGGWRNFGGDKPWPWPQDDWPRWFQRDANWPPPPEADQSPQTARVIGANTVRLTSAVLAKTGLRIVRDITLAETGTRLYTVTRLERVEDGFDFPVGAWAITQTPFVRGSLVVHLPPGETTLAEGWRIMGDKTPLQSIRRSKDGVTLTVDRDPQAKSGRKLGFDGDAIAGMIQDTILVIRADSPGAKGFEWRPGERGQIYVSDAGSPYIEWEFTSPVKPIKKGESVTLVTTLEAKKLAADRNANEALDAAVRGKL
ncbi:MAG: hypothetical protein H8F28_10935 [Fibrella sp.]|nr:hypothetical protein [Armatimonadota bacterium]